LFALTDDGGSYDLNDPRALQALAHPLRGRLLASLRVDGPATASMLGRRYGHSSANASYHLRMLARHGFIEDDPERSHGRERWWRAAHATTTWSPATFDRDPAMTEVAREWLRRVGADYARYFERWVDELGTWAEKWRDAALLTDRFLHLSAGQLASLSADLEAVVERYVDIEPDGDETRHVVAIVQAFPQRGTLP
jgi:DNA-binding transcriptional ArsR family regulator